MPRAATRTPAHRTSGFGLIDVIVGVALLLLLFISLFGVLRTSLVLSSLTKAKASGVELGSTQMEYLRGLSYSNVGTVGGIPAGLVPQVSTSTIDGVTYTVRTFIQYKDDPADGLGVADTNNVTTDYKVGKVTVSYTLYGLPKSIQLLSNFVPPSIETTTGGGTLVIHVVDASGADVSGATVQVVNASTSPPVDFTTFTDVTGRATIGGAATSTQYQVFVSKSGYSSAQTYARTNQNVNPTPGYLTVVKDQTTSSTFAIDHLATLTLSTFSPAVTLSFDDTFTTASNLVSQTRTVVSGGALVLDDEEFSGSARSSSITANYLKGWGMLSATTVTPPGSVAVVHVADATGTLLPDVELPGNSAGFSSFPLSLTGVSSTNYPVLSLVVDLTRSSTSTVPALLDWALAYTDGPTPLPNTSFTLTGAKTVGTDVNNTPLYKTVLNHSTNSVGNSVESLEWDAYSLTPPTNLLESCPVSPYALSPAIATSTALLIGAPSAYTIPIVIHNAQGNTVSNAKVILSTDAFASTVTTSSCGLAYFMSLVSGTYSATVSATGYATTQFPNIIVNGNMPTQILTLP